ncbi:hypothetical protein RUM44_009995 [Polyplax serrata]|uniref:DNA 3'-5' helicase n=1 Tax=Polyplax serrata TaxID=468196 RepID=A0ABR1AUD4_POLSC
MELVPTQYNTNYQTIEDLPRKYRQIFQHYTCFNSVQSQVISHVFDSDNSLVIAAPTGSGKTAVLELVIIKLLMDLENVNYNRDFKIVYVCPVKALCRERYNDWSIRFQTIGISSIEITGDGGDYFDLVGYNIVITTPEKWDSLTRRWRDNAGLVQLVKLFMIDEVHLLSDSQRGPVLEAVVGRMKTISRTLKLNPVRFVAISATIYNVEDLATWLGTKGSPAKYFKFGNEVRPVQLQKIVRGYHQTPNQSSFLFDIQLSYKLKTVILEYASGKPTLVFCSTRKSVFQTAKILADQLTFHFTEVQSRNLSDGAAALADGRLKELVQVGIGYHHAGLTVSDKHKIQNLFVSGILPILVATSTLAMGVNLPAHLVVIKSTQQYKAGHMEEYPESSILQMIGRAGRPQFDTTAIAVIMTKSDMVDRYERLLDSKEIIESSLHLHLPEHLNSEIVLYTITDLSVAMDWICNTFLYVRALKNPKYYGFDSNGSRFKIEKGLEMMCLKEINGLKKAELIQVSNNGMDISPTPNGRLMSHFYLSFQTFKIFLQLKGTETMAEILGALSEAHEFSEIQLRVNERKTLNELNRHKTRDHVRFPLAGKIKTKSMKVNCLIQSCLGCLFIQDPALNQESVRIVKIAERLTRCLSEFLSKKPHYQSLLNTLLLAKCLHSKLWEDSPFLSRQLDRIGPTLGSLLAACNKTSFEAIERSNPRDLEKVLNRAPPFGNHLLDAVRHLPKYNLTVEMIRTNANGIQTNIKVSLLNSNDIAKRNTAGDHHWVSLIVGDTNNNLLSYNRFNDQSLLRKDFEVTTTFKDHDLPHKLIACVISEQWVGVDVSKEIVICPAAEVISVSADNPPKKKRKTEPAKKKLSKQMSFFEKRPKTSCQTDEFVACFDIDIEILDPPEAKMVIDESEAERKNSPPVANAPEPMEITETNFEENNFTFCDFTAPVVENKFCELSQDVEIVEERRPLLSLENIFHSLNRNRMNFGNESDVGYLEFNSKDSGYFTGSTWK